MVHVMWLLLLYSFMRTGCYGVDDLEFLKNVKAADLSESYKRIKSMPLNYYEFAHDAVPGRRQMGVIAPDAKRIFPESVEVVPTYSIPNKDRSQPPKILENYPLVDKSVIFMHGLAAVKELANKLDKVNESYQTTEDAKNRYKTLLDQITAKLATEIDQQVVEKQLLAEAELDAAKREAELETQRDEQRRKAIAAEVETEKELLKYEEELARKRLDHQETLARDSMEMAIQLERELAEKRETVFRETAEALEKRKREYGLELESKKKDFEKEKIRTEIEAKAEQERANEDMEIRKMQTQAKLDTQRTLDMIQSISKHLANLARDFMAQPERILMTLGVLLAMSIIYYASRELIVVLRNFIQARLGRPSLVRETSVHWSFVPRWSWLWGESLEHGKQHIEDHLNGVILSDDDKARVVQLALATRNTKQSGAPYRHVLLHGPPGTGKTLIARRLAECSGMDYAIMSGGDVGPLGEDAVNQLHGLFRWASRSQKGLLVFIDEAEAFLSARGKATLGGVNRTHIRHALNALLYQTGTQSRSFMMVLATNRPEDLDSAILDRIDVSLFVGLPETSERRLLVLQYMDMHLCAIARESQRKWWPFTRRHYMEDECSSEETIDTVAAKCDGFSGREIAKMFIACRYTLVMATSGRLGVDLLLDTVDYKVREHDMKRGFSGEQYAGPGRGPSPRVYNVTDRGGDLTDEIPLPSTASAVVSRRRLSRSAPAAAADDDDGDTTRDHSDGNGSGSPDSPLLRSTRKSASVTASTRKSRSRTGE